MANVAYPLGTVKILTGSIDMDNDTLRVVMLDNSYTYAPTDEFADALTGVLGTPTVLTSPTVLAGPVGAVLNAASVSYPGVTLGQTVSAMAVYKWTGNLATSPLIYFMDENDDGTPITYAGDGANIVILWSAQPEHIAAYA